MKKLFIFVVVFVLGWIVSDLCFGDLITVTQFVEDLETDALQQRIESLENELKQLGDQTDDEEFERRIKELSKKVDSMNEKIDLVTENFQKILEAEQGQPRPGAESVLTDELDTQKEKGGVIWELVSGILVAILTILLIRRLMKGPSIPIG